MDKKTQTQDEEIAMASAGALGASPVAGTRSSCLDASSSAVTHRSAGEVEGAFAKGGVLFDAPDLAIHASRREKGGLAEVHAHETDTFYVLSGSATLVTGGTVVDPKNEAPHEIRGSSIQGGETRQISKGDVVVVPKGVPHWFKDVQGPLLYYTVKVR